MTREVTLSTINETLQIFYDKMYTTLTYFLMMTNVGTWKWSCCYQSKHQISDFSLERITFVRGRKYQLTKTICVFYSSSHLMFHKIKWYLPKPQYQVIYPTGFCLFESIYRTVHVYGFILPQPQMVATEYMTFLHRCTCFQWC